AECAARRAAERNGVLHRVERTDCKSAGHDRDRVTLRPVLSKIEVFPSFHAGAGVASFRGMKRRRPTVNRRTHWMSCTLMLTALAVLGRTAAAYQTTPPAGTLTEQTPRLQFTGG